MARLKGSKELIRRLTAVRDAPRPIAESWAETTTDIARRTVRRRTGATARSIRVASVSARGAQVTGKASAIILDRGARRHAIKAKRNGRLAFSIGGQPVFTKRVNHPGVRGNRFAAKAAQAAMRRGRPMQTLIDQWNGAA